MRPLATAAAIAASLIVAAALRLPGLADRPMHADEAILADRFGGLLEGRGWTYTPEHGHGPALPYLTLLAAGLRGEANYAALTEPTLRGVTAVAGVLGCLVPWLWRRRSPNGAAVAASLFLATSAGAVYYSRAYLPETLFASFTFAAVAMLARGGAWLWPGALCVFAAALAKETWILAFAAALGASILVRRAPPLRLLAALGGALAAAFALLPAAAVAIPGNYLARAFAASPHSHPWHFYFKVYAWEAPLAALALAGAWKHRNEVWVRWLAAFALLQLALYSALPYKTPWCGLNFLLPVAALAGLGAVTLGTGRRAAAITAAVVAYSGWQTVRLEAGPRSPYAYAQTTPDVYRLRDAILDLARRSEDGLRLRVQVLGDANVWPLPWYLRPLHNVEYARAVPPGPAATVVVVTPALEEALVARIYEEPPPGRRELYVPVLNQPAFLRPGVELRLYAAYSLVQRAAPPP